MKVGDIVIKHSGGNKMTIEDISNSIIKCIWFVGSQLNRSEFRSEEVILIEEWHKKIKRIEKIDAIF